MNNELSPLEHFGPYLLKQLIAESALTRCYVAENPSEPSSHGPQKLVKILRSEWLHEQHTVDTFHRKFQILSQVRHAHIAPIVDAGSFDNRPYLVMELEDGISLEVLTLASQERRRLPLDIALLIASDIIDAIRYLHTVRGSDGRSLNLVAASVRSDNIRVSPSGQVTLLDLGDAVFAPFEPKLDPEDWTRFMAPEMIIPGKAVDARADLYAAGALLFELATGKPIVTWSRPSEHLIHRIFRNLHALPSDVDQELALVDPIIDKALQSFPEQRYQSAGELLEEIGEVLQQINPKCSHDQLADFLRETGSLNEDASSIEQPNKMHIAESVTTIPAPPIAR